MGNQTMAYLIVFYNLADALNNVYHVLCPLQQDFQLRLYVAAVDSKRNRLLLLSNAVR